MNESIGHQKSINQITNQAIKETLMQQMQRTVNSVKLATACNLNSS